MNKHRSLLFLAGVLVLCALFWQVGAFGDDAGRLVEPGREQASLNRDDGVPEAGLREAAAERESLASDLQAGVHSESSSGEVIRFADERGTPLAGLPVTLVGASEHAELVTDNAGLLALDAVSGHWKYAFVTSSNWTPSLISLDNPPTEVVLRGPEQLRICVVDARTGEPCRGYELRACLDEEFSMLYPQAVGLLPNAWVGTTNLDGELTAPWSFVHRTADRHERALSMLVSPPAGQDLHTVDQLFGRFARRGAATSGVWTLKILPEADIDVSLIDYSGGSTIGCTTYLHRPGRTTSLEATVGNDSVVRFRGPMADDKQTIEAFEVLLSDDERLVVDWTSRASIRGIVQFDSSVLPARGEARIPDGWAGELEVGSYPSSVLDPDEAGDGHRPELWFPMQAVEWFEVADDGKFEVTRGAIGETTWLALRTKQAGFILGWALLQPHSQPVIFELPGHATLAAQFPNDTPPPVELLLQVEPKDSSLSSGRKNFVVDEANPSRFLIDVPAGAWRIVAQVGHAEAMLAEVQLKPSQTKEVSLPSIDTVDVAIRVTGSVSGPLVGRKVSARAKGIRWWSCRGVTDSNGVAELRVPLTNGSGSIAASYATRNGESLANESHLITSESREIEFRFLEGMVEFAVPESVGDSLDCTLELVHSSGHRSALMRLFDESRRMRLVLPCGHYKARLRSDHVGEYQDLEVVEEVSTLVELLHEQSE